MQQEEREWEEEVDAARRAAAESAEIKRQEREAAEDAADGATTVDEEDKPLGAFPSAPIRSQAGCLLMQTLRTSNSYACRISEGMKLCVFVYTTLIPF